jgi:predicted ATPase
MVVLTGGPGAGKTAVLEVLAQHVCPHVKILPEVAGMLWKGGFPRRDTYIARCAAQRAIVRVQFELQRLAIDEPTTGLAICDRGTLDGLAYWPGTHAEYFSDLDTTEERELGRYAAVIHMQSAPRDHGYFSTALRPETAEHAREIDKRILDAWKHHPNRVVIESQPDFLIKLDRVLTLLRAEVPGCCR